MQAFDADEYLHRIDQDCERQVRQRPSVPARRARRVEWTPVAVAATALASIGLLPRERLRSIAADPNVGRAVDLDDDQLAEIIDLVDNPVNETYALPSWHHIETTSSSLPRIEPTVDITDRPVGTEAERTLERALAEVRGASGDLLLLLTHAELSPFETVVATLTAAGVITADHALVAEGRALIDQRLGRASSTPPQPRAGGPVEAAAVGEDVELADHAVRIEGLVADGEHFLVAVVVLDDEELIGEGPSRLLVPAPADGNRSPGEPQAIEWRAADDRGNHYRGTMHAYDWDDEERALIAFDAPLPTDAARVDLIITTPDERAVVQCPLPWSPPPAPPRPSASDAARLPIVTRRLGLDIEYGQFVVHTDGFAPPPDDPYATLEEAQTNGRFVAVVDRGRVHVLTAGRGWSGTPMTIQVWADEPPDDPTPWDHEVDVDLDVAGGSIGFEAPTASWQQTKVPDGEYRARISGRSFAWAQRTGGGGEYRLQLWPRKEEKEPVLRRCWPGFTVS